MRETEHLATRLQDADGLPALLAAAWDAFEFLQQTAWEFADPQPGSQGFPFLLATAAARHGRKALTAAPSFTSDGVDGDQPPVTVLNCKHHAAGELSTLAARLEERLIQACVRAQDHVNRRALAVAIATAAQTHALLAWAACAARSREHASQTMPPAAGPYGRGSHGERDARPAALSVLPEGART